MPLLTETSITVSEWQVADPASHEGLQGVYADASPVRLSLVESLNRGRWLQVDDVRRGMRIETSSWVGSIDLAGIMLHVQPKLGRRHLPQLLRYAYGLHELELLRPTRTPVERLGFHDLIAAQLLHEVEAIGRRGLAMRYTSQDEDLASLRGRIDIAAMARRGVVDRAALPCRHHLRLADWQLNQVMRAGIELAAGVASARELDLALRRLADRLAEQVSSIRLDAHAIEKAERAITRLTWHYGPALTLIRLLHGSSGVSTGAGSVSVPGFLFDMNSFWQTFLGRLLRRNLPAALGRVEEERRLPHLLRYAAGANPRNRQSPAPRPDFALIRDGRVRLFLDAKYRDVWNLGCPPGWLYQLAIYAVAASERTAVMLYPTEDPAAREERIELVDPGRSGASATIVLRPVHLDRVSRLLTGLMERALTQAAAGFAAGLVRCVSQQVPRLRAA
jgi:5-methylcytosine-specific restriction enzyme subunit McrC